MSFGTWTGTWWLPDSPARVVKGTLAFSEEELTLVLAEPLAEVILEADQVFETLSEPATHPLVHGVVDGGQPTTLVNVNGNASLLPFASATETWFPHWVFIGHHLVDPNQAIFDGALVTMEHLEGWLGGRPPVVSGERLKADVLNVSVSAERKVLHEAVTSWGSVRAVAQPAVEATGFTVGNAGQR